MQPDAKRLLTLVHVGRRELSLDDEDYRALLESVTGSRSAKGLKAAQLEAVVTAMKGLGFKVKGNTTGRRSPPSAAHVQAPEVRKLRAIWITMHRHGLLRDGSETALNHYVERQTVRINNGVGVAEVAWLSEALAYLVLESLKNWHKREMVKALQAAKKTVPINEKTGRVAGYQGVLGVFEEMLHG